MHGKIGCFKTSGGSSKQSADLSEKWYQSSDCTGTAYNTINRKKACEESSQGFGEKSLTMTDSEVSALRKAKHLVQEDFTASDKCISKSGYQQSQTIYTADINNLCVKSGNNYMRVSWDTTKFSLDSFTKEGCKGTKTNFAAATINVCKNGTTAYETKSSLYTLPVVSSAAMPYNAIYSVVFALIVAMTC